MSCKVYNISTNTVRPENPIESPARQELTPWDLYPINLPYAQVGLLFLKPENKEDVPRQINHLMASFSRTLDYFPPLTGRLATETHQDNTISYYIDCNVVGAEFVHAGVDLTVSDILDAVYVPDIVLSFYPLYGLMNHQQAHPLLAVQLTELVDGIFIGFSFNHLVADGTSIWHFINSWSAISRSLDHVPRLPIFKRWSLNHNDLPIRFQPSIKVALNKNPPRSVLCEKIFHFTPQKITQIKLKANEEQETNQISTLQALFGHIWITVTRARNLDPNTLVVYAFAAGNRARLKPPLPDEYFGNSIQGLAAVAKAGELLERGLGWAAWLFNQKIKSHLVEHIHGSWVKFMNNPELLYSHNLFPNMLSTGSSPRFNMYGNDFGWGRPVAARSVNVWMLDGAAFVLPGAVEGSLVLQMSLAPQTMKAVEEDSEFTQLVYF